MSLLPSLYAAIKHGELSFGISGGSKQRDFFLVDEIGRQLLLLATHPLAKGIYNGGSGKARTIQELVETEIRELDSDIKVENGISPDRADNLWQSGQAWNVLTLLFNEYFSIIIFSLD